MTIPVELTISEMVTLLEANTATLARLWDGARDIPPTEDTDAPILSVLSAQQALLDGLLRAFGGFE